MNRRWMFLSSAIFLLTSLVCAQAPKPAVDKTEIVKKARQSYYSLKDLGVKDFNCKVEPDWETMYKFLPEDNPMRTEVVPLLKKTQFDVKVSAGGASVSKKSDVVPDSMENNQRFRVAYGGMEQILTGFFQSWSAFMFAMPFPDPSETFEFEDLGQTYRLTTVDGESTAVVVLDRDLAMKSMRAKTPSMDTTMGIKLDKTTKGLYVISGYNVDIPIGEGKVAPMNVDIKHKEFGDVLLPESLMVLLEVPGNPLHLNIAFKDCQYNK